MKAVVYFVAVEYVFIYSVRITSIISHLEIEPHWIYVTDTD